MIDTIFIEKSARNFPLAKEVLKRFSSAQHIECSHYGEVFNRHGQNFRVQKNHPSLILAVKEGEFVLPAPVEYHVGGRHNYYFSHMLNSPYDCRYCFLQGMYSSAHYVLFVNYEDFKNDIANITKINSKDPSWFFSGYDCDSLAFDPVSNFVNHFVPFIAENSNARMELRTKSTQIRALNKIDVTSNVICAFSFTGELANRSLEHRVPENSKRISAMAKLQYRGWPVAVRFDPMMYYQNWRQDFSQLCLNLFKKINPAYLDSVSIGAFRMPVNYFRKVRSLYPTESLFVAGLHQKSGNYEYGLNIENELLGEAQAIVGQFVEQDRIYTMRD